MQGLTLKETDVQAAGALSHDPHHSSCQVCRFLLLATYDIFVRNAWDCAGHVGKQ